MSLNSPELSKANFQLSEAKAFVKSLRQALKSIDSVILPAIAGHHIDISKHPVSQTIEDRIKFFCEPENFSSRILAQIIHSVILFLSRKNLELHDEKVLIYVIGLYGILKKYSSIFIDNSTRVL